MSLLDSVLERLSGVPAQPAAAFAANIPPAPVAQRPPPPPVPQPVKVPRRPQRAPRGTYLAAMDTPLVRLGPGDDWTIEDACSGVSILGGNGSGKTSASGQTIAKAFLRAGMGGLILCAKPDECANWARYAKACGRKKHLIIVSEDSKFRFNLIDYELQRGGDPAGRVDNLVSTFMALVEQTGRTTGGDERFWSQAAEQLLRNVLMVLAASRGEFTLLDVQKFIDGIPRSLDAVETEAWKSSEMAQRLDEAKAAYEAAGRTADFDAIAHYLTVGFVSLADRTRSSVAFTLGTMLQDLLVGAPRELFSTGTNFVPDDSFEGALIILDLPAILKRSHAMVQTMFKVVWQNAVLRRMATISKRTRPVFLWADESHLFVTDADAKFQSLARASRCATVYLTQNVSSYRAKFGSQNAEALTSSLLGLFQTHVFHSQSDVATIEHAQRLFGKHEVTRLNDSHSHAVGASASYAYAWNSGTSNGNGFSSSWSSGSTDTRGSSRTTTNGTTTSTTMEHVLEARHFTQLTTGSDQLPWRQRHLRGIAQAYVFRLGRTWSNGGTHLLAHFDRRLP